MNDRQNTVVATVVAGLILVPLFLCPWRVGGREEIRWSPIYQPPLSYVRSYDAAHGREGGARIASDEAEIAVDLLALEVVALVVVGGVLYAALGGEDEARGASEDGPSTSLPPPE